MEQTTTTETNEALDWFNQADLTSEESFSGLLPKGTYTALLTKAQRSVSDYGERIQYELTVSDGKHKGTQVRLNNAISDLADYESPDGKTAQRATNRLKRVVQRATELGFQKTGTATDINGILEQVEKHIASKVGQTVGVKLSPRRFNGNDFYEGSFLPAGQAQVESESDIPF